MQTCRSFDEWAAAMKANPEVLGLVSLTDSDLDIVMQMKCSGKSWGVCSSWRLARS